MNRQVRKLSVVIYANPDYYPPLINAINLLSKNFDLVVICRNQDLPQVAYPENVKLYRLGKRITSREKENQGGILKIVEYAVFTMRAIFYTRFYKCRLIYACDMHGFVAGFFANCFARRSFLVYQNFDLCGWKEKGLRHIVKYLEIRLAHKADKIIFSDINRARYFKKEAKLNELPGVVMNAPRQIDNLPPDKLKEILRLKGFNGNARIVLCQGERMDRERSILEVIKSMPFWPKDSILVLKGNIDENFWEECLKEAGPLNLTARIIRLPYGPYPSIFSYTVGASLGLALYNSQELNRIFNAGASNKIFEYMAMGIPVVTNDSVYFREVLDTRFVYFAKPDSVEDIARAVNSGLLDKERCPQKANEARQVHLSRLNFEFQFKPILEFINSKFKAN